MRILIVYYSRTGTTRTIAQELRQQLDGEMEEIFDTKDRSGALGYLSAGRDASLRRLTDLHPETSDPSLYDLVVIGTPIWSWNVSTPIRTYLSKYRGRIKKAAFFCTMGGSGSERAFREMAEISGSDPAATLALSTQEVIQRRYQARLDDFAKQIKDKF